MRGNVLVMTICECVWRSTVDIVWPFLSLYVLALGGNYQTIGLIMSGASFASMVLYPLGGYIADYQGRIKLIGYMTFFYAIAFLVTGLGESWQWLALGLFVQNLTTFYWPAIQALMADSIHPSQRGVGFAALEAIPSAFGLIAPIAGAWLIGYLGMKTAMRGLFLSSFLIASVIALFRLKFLKETIENPQKLNLSINGVLTLLVKAYKGIIQTLMNVTRDLWVLSILVTALIFAASFTSSFWIVRATSIIGLNIQEWGTVIFVSGATGVILGIPVGRIIDRLSKRIVIGCCIIVGSLMVFLFLRASTFNEVVMLAIASAIIDAFLNPSLRSLFADLIPRNTRGRTMALIGGGGIMLMRGVHATSIIGKIFQTVGMLASGYLYSYNNSIPWLILSSTMALIGICFLLIVRDPEKPEV